MVQFLDLKKQYYTVKNEIDEAISKVIDDSAFIGGKYVKKFEEEFAEFLNVKFCLGVANGTDALEIAIEALNIPKGSEIIVPANSFIASSEAVTRSGHKVIFCDCDEENYTISINDLKKKISDNTSAIVAVHLYGHPCDMDEILKIAKDNNLYVIEDCAQAHGSEYKGQRVGAIGDIGTFSFYPGKNLGAYGDGGAITTNDESLARKCRMIANHGRIEKYNHEFEGRNSRLDGLQAAILSVKLNYLESWLDYRRNVAGQYYNSLIDIDDLQLPVEAEWAKHVYHLYVIRTSRRDSLKDFLYNSDVETGIHYPIALSKLKAYEYIGQKNEKMNANFMDSTLLSLPIGEHLNRNDLEKVITKVKEYFTI